MIKANNLYKKYKQKLAVDDVSFVVEDGKVTGFLGPNGAGKSTAMRLMTGLDLGGGTTTYDGKPLHSYPEPFGVVGVLLNAQSFHPKRTARNHLCVLARSAGITYGRVDEVLDIVGLRHAAKRLPGEFSLGMAQRLGIAAAILGKPKHLILDEPANGLDPEGIAWLRQFAKDYASRGNTVFISSHLLSEMAHMADNVIVIAKGKLLADMPIGQLLARNTHLGAFVRAKDTHSLEAYLHRKHYTFSQQHGGFLVQNVHTDTIGPGLYKAGIPLLELTTHTASLEEAFFALTSGSEEYQTISSKERR